MQKYLIEQIDSLFTAWDHPDTPGCVLGLAQDGELIYKRGYGMSNLEYNIPLTPESVLYLASNSKQFMAACVILLAQRGLISLEDEIQKYFPEMPVYAHPVRVKHLLDHTNGLREHGFLADLAGLCSLDYRTADSIAMICRQKDVNYPAGETYLYSNAGFVLQAGLVERVTKQPVPVFIKENIFDPLGMKDSIFSDDWGLIIKNRAASYEPDGNGGYRCLLMSNNVLGSAGVLTTVDDLNRWHENFYQPKVGGEAFVQQMLATGKFNDGRDVAYSAGLIHSEICGLKAVWHGGVEFGFRSTTLRFPEKHFSIFCLANLATFTPDVLVEEITKIFFANEIPPHVSLPKAKPLADSIKKEACGFYLDAGSGAFIEISNQGEEYFAEALGEPIPVTPTHCDGTPDKESLTLEFSDTASPVTLKLDINKDARQKTWSLHANVVKCDLPVLQKITTIDEIDPDSLVDYAGTYYCDEVKAFYEIAVIDGQLALVNLTGLRGGLQHRVVDLFTIGGNSLQFKRNTQGQVDSFRLWNLNARGLEFVRFCMA